MGRPDALPWIVGILAWQSYRVIGFKMIAAKKLECHGGDLFKVSHCVGVALGQDHGIIGSLANARYESTSNGGEPYT